MHSEHYYSVYYGPADAENVKWNIFCGAASKMIPTEPQLPLRGPHGQAELGGVDFGCLGH